MQSGRNRRGPNLIRIFIPLGLSLLAMALTQATRSLEAYSQAPYSPLRVSKPRAHRAAPASSSSAVAAVASPSSPSLSPSPSPSPSNSVPVVLTLGRGETLGQLFGRVGLTSVEAHDAVAAVAERVDVRAIQAGTRYSALLNPDRSLASLELTFSGAGRLALARQAGRWQTDWRPVRRSTELRALRGTLTGSLESSIRLAGGPGPLAFRLAEVLRWDLDFGKDLKRGDSFQVLYEEVQLDGAFHAVGNIVAVLYDNQGRVHEAYRYGGSGVYYDGQGRPLQKMFLRSPLAYSHITSAFSDSRFHPVLRCFRPHYGVDYSAPVGTPVQVTADGVVSFAGWDGGGGNVVKVEHAGRYMSAYLHLSRFARGLRAGARVRQGDVIAYTGQTGLATGPHLDYRVKLKAEWIDPLTLRGVREPIPAAQLASFRSWRDGLKRDLDRGTVPPAMVAAARPAVPPARATAAASPVAAAR
jgi:murein DD-endopeptidase MepM/ murein hydrolase activator NlpD